MARFDRLTVYNTILADGMVPLFYNGDLETAKQIAGALANGGGHVISIDVLKNDDDANTPGGPGNTSLEGGDFPTIMRSLEERLFVLPDETLVLPGHGASTTLGDERPHLDEWHERGW